MWVGLCTYCSLHSGSSACSTTALLRNAKTDSHSHTEHTAMRRGHLKKYKSKGYDIEPRKMLICLLEGYEARRHLLR